MRKAGGMVGLIAGLLGIFGAVMTLLVGGVGSAVDAEDAGTVVVLGWVGLALSMACIALGAVAMSARSRWPGILLIVTALLAVLFGGTIVAVSMALALVGGVLAAIPGRERAIVTPVLPGAYDAPVKDRSGRC